MDINKLASEIEDDDFNKGIILPPLLVQLKKILEQYPDDSQILKELIQNAEDAGAREVKFLYDRRSYGKDPRYLHHQGLAKFQGPALYAYNDGLFDEEDWRGIRMLSQSVKQDDPLKVGYFGMGFKSVFHLTDVPYILSGERLGVIEPHDQYFGTSSYGWNLSKRSDLLNTIPHQIEPFLEVFNCNRNCIQQGYYRGTLFRFPLRNSPSALSDNVYTADKIRRLFDSFQVDAHMVLLFLKRLETVELYERAENAKTPKLVFKVQISDKCIDDVRQKRIEFLNHTQSRSWREKPLVSTYPIEIETISYRSSQPQTQSRRYLVTNYYSGGQVSATFRKLYSDTDLNYPPWVATAMPLDLPENGDFYELGESDGHVFCFLPLPSEHASATGLPVHVNGFFALEQNRKYIKWPSSYRTRDEMMDKRLLWNQCLLREAIPNAYAKMLWHAIKRHNSGDNAGLTVETIYRAFPDLRKIERKWEAILAPFFTELFKHTVVYSSADGGSWISPRDAIFNTLDPSETSRDAILEVLASSEIKVADVPEHVLAGIRNCCPINMGKITPQVVANAFRTVQYSSSLSWDSRMDILAYLLKQSKCDLLDGLELLPLLNGGFCSFCYNPRRAEKPIYFSSPDHPQALLPDMEDDFLDTDIPQEVAALLRKASSKGYTQLQPLTPELVFELLPRCLPSDWSTNTTVTWQPGQFQHPPEEWLKTLWQYLVKQSPHDLTAVENLPIIPLAVDGDLTTVAHPSAGPVIARHLDGLSLSENLEDVLGRLGISVINELPDYIKAHPVVVREYIFSPSYIGVLKALLKLSTSIGRESLAAKIMDATSPDNKFHMCELFSKLSNYELLAEYSDLLVDLPLFRTVDKSGGKESHFVSCREVNLAAPAERLQIPLSKRLLKLDSAETTHLATLLGVTQLSSSRLLLDYIFPDIEDAVYEDEEVETIMLYVLKHYHTFLEEDSTFSAKLKELPFLLRRDMLVTADRFYDPDQVILQNLFLEEERFPMGSYAEPSCIAVLRQIGLRGANQVDAEDLQEVAYTIQDLFESKSCDAKIMRKKSDALVDYLITHEEILRENCGSDPLYECLKDIYWMRPLRERPNFYPHRLQWFHSEELFQKPSSMIGKKFASVAGSVRPTVAKDVCDTMREVFGWDKQPDADSIVKHLANTVSAYNGAEKTRFLDIACKVYAELSGYEPEKVLELITTNKVVNWIWNGEGFTSSDKVVFAAPFMDLQPFVYSLPTELTVFADFFQACGLQQSCHLPNVLRTIRDKYEEGSQKCSNAEVKRHLHMCICILNELKSHVTSEEEMSALQEELVIPIHVNGDNTLKMAPLRDCTYCDQEWLRKGHDLRDLGEEEKLLLVHPNVPNSTAETLGVPTLMSRMLDAEELDFSFGQSDSLTHRLSVLLQEYTDGFAVPKELVQNADDAGATQVKILYDERENRDARVCLIDEGMKECQGPALWAYNDAIFSDTDFENITKLSGATKESEMDKIGRFGLGFNAVYNITDVPSFVSRHNIVIFDPHTTHLGKSIKNKSKPGIKIDMRKHRKKLRRIGNQFLPYNDVFSCNLRPDAPKDSYDATLFRFPLRTKAQAIKSEICQKHYDHKEVQELLQILCRGADSLLLFTQNVTKISVYHLPVTARSAAFPVEIFSASKQPMKILRELDPTPDCPIAASDLSHEQQHFISQCSILKASATVLSEIKSGLSVEDVQPPCSSIVVLIDRVTYKEGSLLLKAKSDRAYNHWLVFSSMGLGQSLRMALQEENLLPTAGVAIPLQHQPGTDYYLPKVITKSKTAEPFGTIFTYMPLPIHSGLPFHVNGSFAVTSSRRHMCERNEDDKFDMRAVWNEALMEDAVCKAYIGLLVDLTHIAPDSSYDYHYLWPNAEHVFTNSRVLMTSFYREIATETLDAPVLFSDAQSWVSIEDAVFLENDFEHCPVGGIAAKVFRDTIQDTSRTLISLPDFVRYGFITGGKNDVIAMRSYDIYKFFDIVLIEHILQVQADERDSLVMYALKQTNSDLHELLQNSSCIPVTPAGQTLKSPCQLVEPGSQLAALYSTHDGKFPHGLNTYASDEMLKILLRLGMARNSICWEDIIERAESISLLVPDKAHKRTAALLNILEQKLTVSDENDEDFEMYREELLDKIFLPVLRRPENFKFRWRGEELDEDVLLSPREVYPTHMKDLVCCVSPILDDIVFPKTSEKLSSFLNFENCEPELGLVLEQLDILTDPETEECFHEKQVYNELLRVTSSIYAYLQRKCSDSDAREEIVNNLSTKKFLLCYNSLLSPSQLAFHISQNCQPFLFAVPESYKRNISELLRVVGVKERFETKEYVSVLQRLHDQYDANQLDRSTLKLVLQLINQLNDAMGDANQSLSEIVEDHGTIYIPDANGVLRSASELCFNEPNCQWVPTEQYTNYSHGLIPFAISKQLGVNTRRQDVLMKHSRGIPFGQRERLTNRIRRILASYPCDKEILRELLQNADDAGATEIHFIKDGRQHGKEKVFDDSWQPLQGPALCVYNNKPFSEADLEGIQKLGEGSKGSDPNQTGQYGVGFNCVYHLTDVPSFLTCSPDIGDTLCLFDPHAQYVPGASSEEPGRRYDDVSELRQIFTDVFSCYMEDIFDLGGGTMFRFPLRTQTMAADSELSDKPVTLETIDGLFSKFKPEMFDCLLFLNNVSSITLSEVSRLTNKFTNTYTVSVDMSDDDKMLRQEFSDYVRDVAQKIQAGVMNVWNIPAQEVTYVVNLSDGKGYFEKWLISQRIGFPADIRIPTPVQESFQKKELALLPRGGVAALLESSDDCDMLERAKKAFCFLPLPVKTELPVNINGHFALDHEARRDLWHDEELGPKSDWNFLLLRKVIAPAYVNMLRRVPEHLSSSVFSANLSFMLEIGNEVPGIDLYSGLLPRLPASDPYWKALVHAVYQHIHESQEPVLPVVKSSSYGLRSRSRSSSYSEEGAEAEIEWLSTSGTENAKPFFDNLEADFPEESVLSMSMISARRRLTSTPKKRSKQDILRRVLLSSGFKLIRLSLQVYEAFRDAGVQVECVSPLSVVEFYGSYLSNTACKIPTLPASVSETPFKDEGTLRYLLEFCMQDEDMFCSKLEGLPLLLCDDGQMRTFSEDDPVFMTTHNDLVPECSFMFLHHALVRTVFTDADPSVSNVFMPFDIAALGSLMLNVLPEDRYRTEMAHVAWDADEDTIPTPRWIYMLWNFIRDEYDRILSEQNETIEEEKLLSSILKPLRDWCILPAEITTAIQTSTPRHYHSFSDFIPGDQYLVPIGLANTIVDFSQTGIMSNPLKECLRKLAVPQLASRVLSGGMLSPVGKGATPTGSNSSLARLLVATLERPDDIMNSIRFAMDENPSANVLKVEECFIVLKYLNDSIDSWKDNPSSIDALRHLRLHLNVHGDIVRLGQFKVYVLPTEIPSINMGTSEKQAKLVFLRKTPELTQLYNVLDCTSLSVFEVYNQFIFHNFQSLSDKERLAHLEFVRDVLLPQVSTDQKAFFLSSLQELEFLAGEDGRFHTAREYYDPYHPVFKVMLSDDLQAFPPRPFSEFTWLEFMRKIGLQHDLTIKMFVDFTIEVAEEGRENPTEETFNKSRTLVTHLFHRHNVATEGLLELISNIAFIPAAKVKPMFEKIFTGHLQQIKTPYIAFSAGVPENHETLVWSSSHLLPDWANPHKLTKSEVVFQYETGHPLSTFENYQRELTEILQIKEDPSVEQVVEHAKHICSDLVTKFNRNDEYMKAFMKVDIMKEVYKFLQNKGMDSDHASEELRDTKCIVVDLGYTFLRPRQVVINLYEEDQITPYLYKSPTELGEFKNLFLYLGATLNPTVDQYAMVLSSIYVETAGEKLHPNEMRAAFKAVHGLFTTLQRHPKDPVECQILYLPSTTGHLYMSTDLVFNNDPTYTDRIKEFNNPFLVDLVECKLTAANFEDMVKLLPPKLQPAMLTSLVQEHLEEYSRDTIISYGTPEKLRHQLNSKAFSLGIIRLIRHEHHRLGQRVQQAVLDAIQEQLKKIRVFGVEKLVTYLSYENKRIQSSEMESECFVDKTLDEVYEEETWNIYIDKSTSLNEELLVSVAEVVNRIVGGLLKNSVHYLQPILACLPHSISKVLDRLKIRPDHSVDFKQPTLPVPGSFIPMDDHHLLKEDFEQYEPGEYIGYELEDDESGGQTFIYAIIVEKVTEEVDDDYGVIFQQKYKVNVGDERKPVTVYLTDLYKFHRVEGFVSRNTSMATEGDRSYSYAEQGLPGSPTTGRRVYESQTPKTPRFGEVFDEGTNGDAHWDYKPFQESFTKPGEKIDDGVRMGNGHAPYGQVPEENDEKFYSSFKDEAYRQARHFSHSSGDGAPPGTPGTPRYDEAQSEQGDQEDGYREATPEGMKTPEEPKTTIPPEDETPEQTIERIMEEVSDQLEEAWTLPAAQKKKIIKRLLLRWHPDKNIGDEAFATVITQHMQSELERLEMGLPRPEKFEEFQSQFSFDPRNPFAGSDQFQKNFYKSYKYFFDQMNQRAKEHKEQRERYKENFSREYASSKADYNFDVPPSFSSSNPQPTQAKRFLKQAQEDLRAADNDYEAREPAYEWVCFKAHQAAEKALKAAQFSVDAITSFSHDLTSISATIDDMELRRLANKLQNIIKNSNKLYNPDPIDFVIIPHEEYSKDMACDAVMCSADILERVKEFVEMRE